MIVLSNNSPRFTSFRQAHREQITILQNSPVDMLILASVVVCLPPPMIPRVLCRQAGAALGTLIDHALRPRLASCGY